MAQKTQNKTQNKKSVLYIVMALVAAILGVLLILKAVDNIEQEITNPQTEQVAEKVTARIDLTTDLVDAENPPFEVYINTSKIAEKQREWMFNLGYQGYTAQTTGNEMDIKIKVLNDAEIVVVLRGPDERDANNNRIEKWVDYTSVLVDGKEILPKMTAVWHNKPFRRMIEAKAGDVINIKAKWKKHNTVVAE